MSFGTQESIRIDADPRDVLDVIVDVESYPQWSRDMKRVDVLETGEDGRPRRVRFEVDAGLISDTYELEYSWDVDEDGAGEVSWRLLQSRKLEALDGRYVIEGDDDVTLVTYGLSVDVAVPLPSMVRRKAEKSIVTTALQGLRRRVEA